MRFALIGNHPDGLAMARALVATGQHELAVTCEVDVPEFAPQAKTESDIEEVLADPAIHWVIVAGPLGKRGEQLRRTVQSEHDAMCVHPCSDRPDLAYEVALIAGDSKRQVVSLTPETLHPVVERLKERLKNAERFELLQWNMTAAGELGRLGPSWPVLRAIGGEIVEVSGLAPTEEITGEQPLLIAGRFENGGLFQVTMRPRAAINESRLVLNGPRTTIVVEGPHDDGSAVLRWQNDENPEQVETFGPTDKWARFAAVVLEQRPVWNDEVRALELQDGLRRSVEKRRTSSLEFQEISEEVGNKGTLTLIGCSIIWIILLIFGLSIWIPWIRWAIVPLLVGYLGLLGVNWLARKR